MNRKPKILITNDDGIHAPGLLHLWKALKETADLTIIAPSAEQSAVGLSITLRNPLHIQQVRWSEQTPAWSVSGTPADCVKMALSVILDSPPDLIVSGINRGSNSGRNVLYSGTVGGVIEGIMHDIPGIAFSCSDYDKPDFSRVEKHIPKIVDYILKHPLAYGTLLNVNFPLQSHGEVRGIKMTRQGQAYWMEDPDKRSHPTEGHTYYWLGIKQWECEEHDNSDVYWLERGYATAVPVHVAELTDHDHLSRHKDHFENMLNE